MAKDPAFLFYPGDYLQDTQCLSERTQVAYDRIMCEHMRNICITQQQLNFFTKRLTDDEKSELMMLLTEVDGGFQIEWVAESIRKRREYSDSRRKNREGKPKKHMKNICKTYVKHMENEIVNENINEVIYPFNSDEFLKMWDIWKEYKAKEHKFKYKTHMTEQAALKHLAELAAGDEHTAIQIIIQSIQNAWKGFFELKDGTTKRTGKGATVTELAELFASKYGN